MQWIKKYKPSNLNEIIGNKKQITFLKQSIINYNKKPIFIYGNIGSGKTLSVELIAKSMDLELVELNASDTRNKKLIEQRLEKSVNQGSLFGKGKLILIDEVEGLSGMKDRGALSAILKLADKSKYPIIMVGDSIDNPKLKSLRKKCELLEFESPSIDEIKEFLEKILINEKIEYELNALKQLARMSGSDVRAAVNDLQSLSFQKVDSKSLKMLSNRNSKTKIKDALTLVFKTKNMDIARGAYDLVDEDLDKIFLWLEENLAEEYKNPKYLDRAMKTLSKADIFYGRIMRRQYYRFYVYCYLLLSSGIAIAKDEKNPKTINYKRSTKPLKIWIYNNSNAKRKNIASKIATATHISEKQAFKEYDYMKNFLLQSNITQELDLVKEEKEWIKKKL